MSEMDYAKMIEFHNKKEADATIAVIRVPLKEASRFGIMNTDEDLRIREFEEKPANPKSDMASMGVYVFKWDVVKRYLEADAKDPESANDFGKNVIPAMLKGSQAMYAYPFGGYWKDVGTIESLWEANMELLADASELDLQDPDWRIYSRNPNKPPHYVGNNAHITNSIVTEGCFVHGNVKNSVLFPGVVVEEGAYIEDSILMADSRVRKGAKVTRAIVDEEAVVGENASVGEKDGKIAVLGANVVVVEGSHVEGGRMVGVGQTV